MNIEIFNIFGDVHESPVFPALYYVGLIVPVGLVNIAAYSGSLLDYYFLIQSVF